MLLSGHEGGVYCCKFHPNGSTLASAGFDRLILLWNVYGDCNNYATLKGHSGAVIELHYNTDGSMLFSASTGKTVAVWDSETGEKEIPGAIAIPTQAPQPLRVWTLPANLQETQVRSGRAERGLQRRRVIGERSDVAPGSLP
ncbi:U5 small nuclear ribonucleoprotein 40 kDa protein [Heterocephalus glaber]|uniref:U5 small nuclear ribonucleoprotein 40 kDa protein n=1 Tax=Heterocephalus glaber TaxID=10181 RepID=G5AL16_HETGA|nr:U5 small nuclear ribonucleoprotein 40 kDa protein [Heterocephalus glaber]